MLILAVDTSTAVATVVVAKDSEIVGEYLINHKKTHSQKLMPMIESVLKELEIKISDIDVFGACIGPGSFTGLRIGITSIKAMAYVKNKPTVGVHSLEVLAYNISPSTSLVCPMIDARNRQVFTCIYEWKDGAYRPITEQMGVGIEELVEVVKNTGKHTIFLGEAVLLHRDFFKETLGDICGFALPHQMLCKAGSLFQAVSIKISEGKFLNSFELEPFYLRLSQAERLAGEK